MDECKNRYLGRVIMDKIKVKEFFENYKKFFIIAGAVLAALAIIYIGFSIYFMNHFYFGSKINGIDVSGASIETAKPKVQAAVDNYELVLVERDGSTDSILGREIDLKMEWYTEYDKVLEGQNGFAWIVKLFVPESYDKVSYLSYNANKLESTIEGLSCMKEEKQVMPQNATVSKYSAETGYVLVPAVEGTAVNKAYLNLRIKDYIQNLKTEMIMAESDVYYLPEVGDTDETLLAAIDQMNVCASAAITYQVGESTEVLDVSIFHSWLYVNDDLEVCIDEESLNAYVKDLASNYNTCYSAKKFMTSYETEVTITNSHYGWKVDNTAEKEAITADIMAGNVVTRDLNYSMTANTHEGNDYGNSYVEINLTAQHLFLYVDGELVLETDFVSGDVSDGNATPTGIFGLTYKEKNATLNGEGYSTPVNYWMPFNGNVGMHDATWRGSFGASIYKRNGSHGCINLPYGSAETIYEYVSTGFPVVVYELAGTQSDKGIAQDQAYVVIDLINAIGAVSLESEAAIVNARTQYDALSDTAKAYVSNYQILLDSEAALATMKPVQ